MGHKGHMPPLYMPLMKIEIVYLFVESAPGENNPGHASTFHICTI